MVQNCLRDFETYPEPLKAGCARPAQIVKAPICHAGFGVESLFHRRKAFERAAKAGEDKVANAGRVAQYQPRWFWQWHYMLFAILGPDGGYSPNRKFI